MTINYIRSIKYKEAEDNVKAIYDELKSDLGGVFKNISLHALNPVLLKGCWEILREVILVEGRLSRLHKEAISTAVSKANECGFCIDGHTIMIAGLKDHRSVKAILNNRPDLIKDLKLQNLIDWSYKSQQFNDQGSMLNLVKKHELPEAIGSVVFCHYMNRLASTFMCSRILPFKKEFLNRPVRAIAARVMRPTLKKELKSKVFLTETYRVHQKKLLWAASNEQINYVFSKYCYVLNIICNHYVPSDIKAFIKQEIKNWDGKEKGYSDELFENIASHHRILAKVMYLQAFAPAKINPGQLIELKKYFNNNDEAILTSLAWVSFETALGIGSQLYGVLNHKLLLEESENIFF